MDRPLRSPGGGIQVITTERGLPTSLKLHGSELSKTPHDLAQDILQLCRLSAARAQVARRRELVERGFAASVVNSMPLATEADLSRAEAEYKPVDDDEDGPSSWLRSV